MSCEKCKYGGEPQKYGSGLKCAKCGYVLKENVDPTGDND